MSVSRDTSLTETLNVINCFYFDINTYERLVSVYLFGTKSMNNVLIVSVAAANTEKTTSRTHRCSKKVAARLKSKHFKRVFDQLFDIDLRDFIRSTSTNFHTFAFEYVSETRQTIFSILKLS